MELPYLVFEKLSALLRQTKSKNNGDFFCFNYLHLLDQKTDLNHIKSMWKKIWCCYAFCKILKFNQY